MFLSRIGLKISVLLILAVGVVAQQPDRIQKDVKYLASDALEGRRTGTNGATDAAGYIAKEFGRLGLKPVASSTARNGSAPRDSQTSRNLQSSDSRFLQRFPYVSGVSLGKENSLTLGNQKLDPGTDWLPLGFSSSTKVSGKLVFAGYGITATELNHNDYANGNAAGNIAVVLQGSPDAGNPHGQFASYEGVRWKAVAAKNAGVKALVVIANEANFKDDRLTRLAYDNTAGDAGLPVIVVSRAAAERLLASADLLLSQLDLAKTTGSTLPGSATLSTDVVRTEVAAYNVIGMLEGSDPLLKKEVIILGAHYDHLGRGGEGSGSLAPRSGDIHYGADDNASGTAGVLELARLFTTQTPKPKRTIVFMAFGGEEEGLLGSNYYVNHPLLPLANTVAMINMDMIGRMKDSKLVIGGVGTAKEWRDLMAAEKAFQLTLNEDGFGPSDHSSFYAKQIPVLFFWTGTHTDYHKPSDTFEKINYDDEARILALVARVVKQLDAADKRVTYTTAKSDPAPRTGGFRVFLGTIPSYADSDNGLLLDGVRDDSPASKAGLKAGDRIVKIGARDIKNVYDYTAALGEMKAGEEYAIEVVRGTERLSLKIKPEARK
jgi:hypothetical protein